MLIDTHCHLTDKKFTNVCEIILEAKRLGVEKIFIPSTSVEDAKKAVEIAEREQQYAMVGVHPEEIDTVGDVGQMKADLKKVCLGSRKVIGIGEIGLDFYWDKEKKTKGKQLEIFRSQMELAVELNMPVAIHMREAELEMEEALNSISVLPRGEFHCFAGGESFLNYILEKGFYVGFDGNVTYKTATELRNIVKKVPLNRLLLETDSPYLSPEPHRGAVNRPANVKIVAEFLAQELNVGINNLVNQTGKNALCLYSLDV